MWFVLRPTPHRCLSMLRSVGDGLNTLALSGLRLNNTSLTFHVTGVQNLAVENVVFQFCYVRPI